MSEMIRIVNSNSHWVLHRNAPGVFNKLALLVCWTSLFITGTGVATAQTLVTSIDFNDGAIIDKVTSKSDYDTGLNDNGYLLFNDDIAKSGKGLQVDFLRYLRIPLDVVAASGGNFTVKYDYYHLRSKPGGSTLWHVHSFALRDQSNNYGWSHGFRNIGNDYWSSAIKGFARVGGQVKGDAAAIPDFDKNNWHEYVLVFDGNRVTWYVDGVFAYYQVFNRDFAAWDWTNADIMIGARYKEGSITELEGENFYLGTAGNNLRAGSMAAVFDNVRIWDGALDAATIAQGVENLIPQAPFTALSQKQKVLGAQGGAYSLKIFSNTDWNLTGLPYWAAADNITGNGDAKIKITVEANPNAFARSAELGINGQQHNIVQSALLEPVNADAVIYPDTKLEEIEYVFYDLKSLFSKELTDKRADQLFLIDGFNGVRTSIYGTRDNPGKAEGKPAHPAPGVVDPVYYAKEVDAIKKAMARNPDLIVFASKKLNGKFSFPEWVLQSNGILPQQYAIMLADYIEYMASEGIPTHILGIDNEQVFNEGKIWPDRFRKVVDEVKLLSEQRGFPMPLVIGHEDFGPDRGNWMRNLVNKGWSDRLDIFGTHYYPADRVGSEVAKLESDINFAGSRDRWHSELHWNTKAEIPDIDEIEDGFGSLLDMTDRGFNSLMWWNYTRGGLRGNIMRTLTSNLLGYSPVMVNDHDGVGILTDGKLHTRAFRNGNRLRLWVLNMNPANQFNDYAFKLDTGAITGNVSYRQWSPGDNPGTPGQAALIDNTGFSLTILPMSVTFIKINLDTEDTLLTETWDSATSTHLSGWGVVAADQQWLYKSKQSSAVTVAAAPLPFSGNALNFGSETDPEARTTLKTRLSVPVNVDSMASVTLKAQAIINHVNDSAPDDAVVSVGSFYGNAAYEIVFNSNRRQSSTIELRVKGQSGERSYQVGWLADQIEDVPYNVTATFKKVAENQTEITYTVYRHRMFWRRGKIFLDTAVGPYHFLAKVAIRGVQNSNVSLDEIEVLGSELITDIRFSSSPFYVHVGQTRKLRPWVTPFYASNKNFDWVAEDPGIATVDENGMVTGVGAGTTYIIATTTDGSALTARKEVVVREPVHKRSGKYWLRKWLAKLFSVWKR